MVLYLERTLDLSREYSSYFAPYKHIADPHIDDADEGLTVASTLKLFRELKRQLVPMVRAICEQPAADDSSLRQTFAKAAQLDFARHVAESFGYEFERGRLDLTHHPFCSRFSAGDVRITTRVSENDFGDALFSTLHEAGHAMYEQGISAALDGTPLGHGVSAGSIRASRGSGRMWWCAAPVFGNTFTRHCSEAFRSSCQACHLPRSIAQSIRWHGRLFAPTRTR